jgi:nicotinamidase-related amidase
MGILAGCKSGELFTEGTWNADFCDTMKPQDGDITIIGKRGLDAFPNTTLDAKLKEHGIEHVVLGGFLTNCCVESTMRTAYEKGYDVITLTDCTACTTSKGQEAAAGPDGTFGMFSTQKTAVEFLAMLA